MCGPSGLFIRIHSWALYPSDLMNPKHLAKAPLRCNLTGRPLTTWSIVDQDVFMQQMASQNIITLQKESAWEDKEDWEPGRGKMIAGA